MPKLVVRSDESGLYFQTENKIIRPVNDTTFNENDTVDIKHCSGTILYGVGKSDNCGRGEYMEAWFDTGLTRDNLEGGDTNLLESIVEGRKTLLNDYPILMNDGKFSFNETREEHNKLVIDGKTSLHEAFRNLLNVDDVVELTEDDLKSFMDNDIIDNDGEE